MDIKITQQQPAQGEDLEHVRMEIDAMLAAYICDRLKRRLDAGRLVILDGLITSPEFAPIEAGEVTAQ